MNAATVSMALRAPGTPNSAGADEAPSLRLVTWAPCPRGRLLLGMLEFKRLPYRLAGEHGALPWPDHCGPEVAAALEISGRLVTALDEIGWALERLAPARPLLPHAAAMRALCLALTQWADDSLLPLTLYYQWMDPVAERQRGRDFSASDAGQRALARRRRQVRAHLLARGLSNRPPSQVTAELARQLHTIDAMLDGRRFLFGSAPTLADFAIASQLAALAVAPGSAGLVAQRPAISDYLDRAWSLTPETPVVTQGSFARACR